MRYRVELSDEAWRAIRAQASYIASDCKAPDNAARWLSRILEAADTLEAMPFRRRRAIEDVFFQTEVRVLKVDGFSLFFTVDKEARIVRVINARHDRQLPLE